MASNIRVTLEVDNKKYIADVKAADRATKDFANSTANSTDTISNNFKRLGGSTDVLHKGFMRLKGVIAGGLFAGMAGSAIKLADELSDLSAATGITIGNLVGLRDAIMASGGSGDQMATAVNRFMLAIDEAAQGSLKAQNRFEALGIGLKELGTLSEADLLRNTLIGIAGITDKARQAALMMEYFGKSFRTVDPKAMLAALDDASGKNDAMADSIKRAAELNDKFEKSWTNIRLAFLQAIEPILDWFSQFEMDAQQTKDFINGLATAFKALGVVIATVFVVTGIRTIVTALLMVGRGVGVLFSGLGRLKDAFSTTVSGRTPAAIMSLKDVFSALGAAVTIVTGTVAVFWDSMKGVGNWISGTFKTLIDEVAASMFGLASGFGAMKRFENPFGAYSKGVEEYREHLKTLRAEEARRNFAATDPRRADQGGAPGATPTPTPTPAGDKKIRDTEDALAGRRKEIARNIEEFKRQTEEMLKGIQVETNLIGKSEEYAEVIRAQEEVYKRAADKVSELQKAKESLSKDEAKLAGAYDLQIAAINKAAEADSERIKQAVENQQGLKLLEKDRLAGIERLTKAMEQQAKIQETLADIRLGMREALGDVEFAGSQQGKSPFAQQAAQIVEDARKAALEAGRAFAAAFEDTGDGMTPEKAKEFADGLAAIQEGYKGIADAQMRNLEASRTWEAGWKEAFAAYSDDAMNAAKQSKTYFETFTSGMEDVFVNFVRTGKLSFKDLANSLIADFARIQAKKAIAGLFGMGGGLGGGAGGGIFSSIGKIFGFANGGNPAIGVPAIVGENGPEMIVPRNASTVIPNGAMAAQPAITNVTYNINATDAQSFKQQLARDPSFLHAVVEQGRRSTPAGARR
jgi:hypothetical protein